MCTILAIESSCDETSAAVLNKGKILTNVISSQEIHSKFGGVVPEIASRFHQKNIIAIVDKAMTSSGFSKNDLDAVAFTKGPGLIGSLLVASSFAKGLSISLEIPLIGVNHLQAHVLSNFIDEPKPEFPFLSLLISGGHTQIIIVKDHSDFEIIGRTLDDAAGEAFDKAAKIAGLPYPGGVSIDRLSKNGDINAYKFPTPKTKGLDFSFSGLKTSFLYTVRDQLKENKDFLDKHIEDLCASYQHRIVSYLLSKLEEASVKTGITNIALAGGVAANSYLRKELSKLSGLKNWRIFIPEVQYCTDNAAMIAITAYYSYKAGNIDDLEVNTFARM